VNEKSSLGELYDVWICGLFALHMPFLDPNYRCFKKLHVIFDNIKAFEMKLQFLNVMLRMTLSNISNSYRNTGLILKLMKT
jgi:hypothetical protein